MVCRIPVFPSDRVFNTTTFSLSTFVGSVARGIPRAFFTWLCSWLDVAIGGASVSWWCGIVLVEMLGGGGCSGRLGLLLLYFTVWAIIVG
ncbi:unnamed protein product [Malus baccata var. baccata]